MPRTKTKNQSVVYKVVSPSGKFYIGSTCDIYRRLTDHFNGRSNKYLGYAARKYGIENLTVEILYKDLDRLEAYEIEQRLLDIFFKNPLNVNFSATADGCSKNGKWTLPPTKSLIENEGLLDLEPILKRKIKEQFDTLIEKKTYSYAIRTPENDIVFLCKGELTKYCRSKGLEPSHLFARGYTNDYFFTKDLSSEGLTALLKAKTKDQTKRRRAKKVKILLNGEVIETVTNLKQWCRDNDLPYYIAVQLAQGKNLGSKCPYRFEYQ